MIINVLLDLAHGNAVVVKETVGCCAMIAALHKK